MAYFLFIDESGQDHRDSPYEVLAGVAVEDRDLWNLIQAIQEAEYNHFGIRYSDGSSELKGKKLLKRKVFRQAGMLPAISPEERTTFAKFCLTHGDQAGQRHIVSLAQAKLAYVREVFDICARFRCKAFASIVSDSNNVASPDDRFLRKDYMYMFERFFYYLEDGDVSSQGVVVFDELEKSQSHVLVNQMDRYFRRTENGRQRSGRIIPEPFFVHSDLTTGVQLADLVAYITSWAFRVPQLQKPGRPELKEFMGPLCQLRYRAVREVDGNPNFVIWSFAVI